MYFLGGLRMDTFVIPIIQENDIPCIPHGDTVEELADFTRFGHVYKFVLPNLAILKMDTKCCTYSPVQQWKLKHKQLSTLLALNLTTANGQDDVASFLSACADEHILEEKVTASLQQRLNWHISCFHAFPLPMFICDKNLDVMCATSTMRDILQVEKLESATTLPDWMLGTEDMIHNVMSSNDPCIFQLSQDIQERAIRILPITMTINDKPTKYCCVCIYAGVNNLLPI